MQDQFACSTMSLVWTTLVWSFEHQYDQGMEQSRSTQQIEQDWDHVASLAADLHDAHARLVDFVVAVLADGSWQAAGLRSPEHWLMLRAGLSRGQAGAMVLLARRAQELPATVAALREGRISLDQAAVVARHTPAAFDTTVAEFAQHATVTQLQRTVTRYDFTLQPDSVDDRGRGLPGEMLPGEMPASDESGDESGGEGGDRGYRKRVPVEPASSQSVWNLSCGAPLILSTLSGV